MLSDQTQLLRLSQGHLNLLERCPRQFQHTYLEQLHSPSDPELEERLTLGSRFHLLMQQREMGLPIDSFLAADAQLQRWMEAFADVAPEILSPPTDHQTFRESEHYRTLQVQDYLLVVVYDLLIADNTRAQILDWKTYPKPLNQSSLERNWQTLLYMYLLAETSDYPPEHISMTYWFVHSQRQPENITIYYDTLQHQQTAKKLNDLLTQLTHWLERYQYGESFPQVPEGNKVCENCQYALRCNRKSATSEFMSEAISPPSAVDNTLLNLDMIQEITL
jgi:hypothetical protein